MPVILAFDIGVKNLAYAVLSSPGTENSLLSSSSGRRENSIYDSSTNIINALENVNLMADEEPEKVFCSKDHKKPIVATYSSALGPTCKRHCPSTHPILLNGEGKPHKTHAQFKAVAKDKGIKTSVLKDDLLGSLRLHYSLPLVKAKKPKVAGQSLADIHDALRKMATERWSIFKNATHVLLENQPAFKNPHMKSVQVLLFAVLREKFLVESRTASFHLVHAKKKVQDATAGDEGYAERKRGSEARIHDLFTKNPSIASEAIKTMWLSAKKKSDMADAVCMCVDWGDIRSSA